MKHGLSNTKIHQVWRDMKGRCNNNKSKNYKYYGAIGISVCDEWENDFLNFYNWAINSGYSDNLTIDRIDVFGNYNPGNCRWANKSLQMANRRNVGKIEYIGVWLHQNKSCYCTRITSNKKVIFSYSNSSKNNCAIKRNEFIISNNLEYPLNIIIDENEDIRKHKNDVFLNVYDKNNHLIYEKVKEREIIEILHLSKAFVLQCLKGTRNSKKYIFERCL